MKLRFFFILLYLFLQSHFSYAGHINKFVGIQYSIWFNEVQSGSAPLIYPNSVAAGAWRYWGTPARGQYLSTNVSVISQHADEISSMDIDFIYIDLTNSYVTPGDNWKDVNGSIKNYERDAVHVLLTEYQRRLNVGLKTPKVVFYGPEYSPQAIYNEFYNNSQHIYSKEIFFNYGTKPLILIGGSCSNADSNNFNCRPVMGLSQTVNQWSNFERTPQYTYFKNDWSEEVPVSPAQQMTYMNYSNSRGRKYNYLTGKNDGYDGQNFKDQWDNVYNVSPTFVLIKSYNEWAAIAVIQENNNKGELINTDCKSGDICFTDQYNPEFSSDIELMGPANCATDNCRSHGDQYVNLTRQYVTKFKSIAANLVVRDSSTGKWSFRYGRKGDVFADQNYSSIFSWAAGAHYQQIVGDFNNDGLMDIGLRDSSTGTWYFAFSNGNGTYSNTRSFVWAAGVHYQPFVGDFNGDGKTDIGLRDTSTGIWYFAFFDGNNFYANTRSFAWASGANYQPLIGDFNGDGLTDIGLRDSSIGRFYFAFFNGGNYYNNTRSFDWAAGANYQPIVGDFNCDGKSDIGLRDINTGYIHLAIFDGSSSYTNEQNYKFLPGAQIQIAATQERCN